MTDDTILPFSFPAVRAQESHRRVRWRTDHLGRRRDAAGGGRAASRHRPTSSPRRSRTARSEPGHAYVWPISCAPASSPSPAATRTPTISTVCAPIRRSSSPAGGCRTAVGICARSRRCRGWRTRRDLRTVIRLAESWSICGSTAIRRRPPQRDARHRRHLRRRPRPPAALAVQRSLRRALLPADPRLRHGDEPAGGDDPASRQDAGRQGDPWPSAPPGPAHPPSLAHHPHHDPRRRPLRPAGGDGRGARTTASTTSSVCPATSRLDRLVDEAADDIRTRRALEKQPVLRGFTETRYQAKSWKIARRACRPHRGDDARPRHPLRRHQPRHRLGRAGLRQSSTAPAARPRT